MASKGNKTTSLSVTDVYIDLVTATTNVNDLPNDIPTVYALSQNYPNPFNPTTTINYDLPKNSFVNITIYDALGRVVSTLVNDYRPASRNSVVWNASNVSTGVYFYRITAHAEDGSADFTQVKKLVLMK